jgi:hypothetical protein
MICQIVFGDDDDDDGGVVVSYIGIDRNAMVTALHCLEFDANRVTRHAAPTQQQNYLLPGHKLQYKLQLA